MCYGNQNPAKHHQELSDEKSTSRTSSHLSNVYTALKELKKKKLSKMFLISSGFIRTGVQDQEVLDQNYCLHL